jgi:uncharacterized membrane protein HdeD (DUF308 family)
MRPMAGVARIVLIVVGVLLILVGIAMAITSQAELWYAPVVVGACIALVGVVFIVAGRSLPARR